MTYNLAYDVCAIPILGILIFISHRQRQAPFLQNRRYYSLLLCVLGLVVFDILDAASSMFSQYLPISFLYTTSYLYFAFLAATPFMVIIYTYSLTESSLGSRFTPRFMATYIPIALWYAFIITNPLHNGLFYYDAAGVYHRGAFQFINYIVTAYYVIYSIVYVSTKSKLIDRRNAISIYFFAAIGFVASLIQLFFESQLIIPFFTTAGVLVMFLTVQRPDSYLDSATGMLNKSTFDRLFSFYTHTNKLFGVVFVYIEDLRLANQAVGVDKVNHIMSQIGEYLETFARNRTFYVGNSTFAIIVDEDNKGLEKMADDIHSRFDDRWGEEGFRINLSCRTLIIMVPTDASELDQVVAYNQCLADAQGLDTTYFLASDMNIESVSRRLIVESCIKRAIDENNFVMYYQPIISTKTGKVVSAEALIRLVDPEYGFIPPDEFIVIAEKNGTILKIGEIVFRNVFSFIRDNDLKSRGIEYIEVNLSVVQCMQEDMSEKLIALMEEYDVESGRINLEITETAAIESSRTLVKNMNHLVDYNVSFSLDDFGSGYANMNSVLDLPLDMVKFDKHMVDVATEKDKGKIVLANSATMIKSMDMKIVAEGVETADQVEEMKKMGVDYIQGFYYSRPVPGQAFVEFVDEFNGVNKEKTA